MLSRVADAVFWINRYVERAENVARFVHVTLRLMLDMPRGADDRQWLPLVITTGDRALFAERYGEPTRENVLHFLSFDKGYANSIISCLAAARHNARSVRETISTEMWEQLNGFHQQVREAAASPSSVFEDPHDFYTLVKMQSHLFAGLTDATMSHSEAWHFGRIGRLLERADKTSRILDVKYFLLLPSPEDVGRPIDRIQWAAVLRSASALEMYRKTFHQISPPHIVQFLVLDPLFPRSIRYCLIKAEESLRAISDSAPGTFSNPAERRLGRLRSELDFADVDEIFAAGVHEFLDNLQVRLNDAGEAIYEQFLRPRPARESAASGEGQ